MINLWVFVPACFALNMAFGPNNLMSLTNGAQRGIPFAVTAGMGRILAFAPMIALSAAGMGLLLSASAMAFTVLKIIGAAYLIWIGARILMSRTDATPDPSSRPTISLAVAFRREALVAIGNPKAILIFAAFFPQFVSPATYWADYALVGALFLVLEVGALAAYACFGRALAGSARNRLALIRKGSGIGMIVFGILLLFTRRSSAA